MRPWPRPHLARLPRLPRLAAGTLLAVATLGAAGTAAVVGEAALRARLDAVRPHAAVRIYARPVVLRAGMPMPRREMAAHLDRLGYEEVGARAVRTGEYRRYRDGLLIGRRGFRHAAAVDPGGRLAVRFDRRERIDGLWDESGAIAQAILEPELLALAGPSAADRIPVPLGDVPAPLVQAVLTIEDQRFADHGGLDVRRIGGAALANLRAGQVVQGASTVTQQLARTLFLTHDRTIVRKVRETAMAVGLEFRHDKDEILEAYLNEVYLGQDAGRPIHGVGRAAQYYFGRDVAELDLAEAALLAAMIRGPNLYHPVRNPETARARRDLVIELMYRHGLVNGPDAAAAMGQTLPGEAHPAPRHTGRYFADHVRPHVAAAPPGGAVVTTLDARLQRAAEAAVRQGLTRLEREAAYLQRVDAPLQAALVALDPATGDILAMVGGRNFGETQFNRATRGRRQPGSAFKPIVALAALAPDDRGSDFTLASVLEDEPLSVVTPAGRWEPENYDGRYRGPVTLRSALERSLNVPFARLGLAVGPARIVQTARALGIESRLRPYPAIALGAFEVTPLEMARAFGVFAAGGWLAEPQTVLGVLDGGGHWVRRTEPAGRLVAGAAEAYLVTSALSGAVDRGTGRGLRRWGYRGPVAAKSGTSSDFRDAWFIGYTPTLVVAVWVGFDDGRSIGLPGSRAALPIFAAFLEDAVDAGSAGTFRMPDDIEIVAVDARGRRAGWGCRGNAEVFIRGTAPEESCRAERWVWRDRRGGNRR